jgi:dihydroxyacid dehydratase/phosphogluconate dehydratase
MKYLLEKGYLHGECVTVTGRTIAQNLADVPALNFDTQDIIVPIERALKATGHVQILYGNLAQKGSVAKITGKEGEKFSGPARVFNGEFELVQGIQNGRVKAGDVVVIRYVGRTRDARDAEAYFCDYGRWIRKECRAHYRWPILRWIPRIPDRTHYAGSV